MGVDPPVASLVACASMYLKTLHMVTLVFRHTKVGHEVHEDFPVRQLGEGQAEKLIFAGKGLYFVVAAVAL